MQKQHTLSIFVIRIITDGDYLDNTNKLFIKLSILKLKEVIDYRGCLLANKVFHNMHIPVLFLFH